MARGVIHSRARAKQLNDFSRLRFKNITPSDIDGFVEFGGETFVFIEVKYNNKDLDFGQRFAYENVTDALFDLGKTAYAIHCNHFVHDVNDDVDVYECRVIKIRYMKWWHYFNDEYLKVGDLLNSIYEEHNSR